MSRTPLCLAALAATLLAAPALAASPTAATTAVREAELDAQAAALENRWQDAAAAAARAYNTAPSLENEFNLASAYENTGRATLAIPLYREVAAQGDLSVGRVIYDYRRTRGPAHKSFYLADEASARLEALTGVAVPSSAR